MKFLSIIVLVASTLTGGYGSIKNSKNSDPDVKQEAYDILVQKCNVCHQTKNPNKVFTKDNMDGFAKKIKRQVFLWKRMPKGGEIKLTKEEKQQLKKWIKSL